MPQSDQYIMRFPFINTLVYLTNEGAPTVRCVSTTFSPVALQSQIANLKSSVNGFVDSDVSAFLNLFCFNSSHQVFFNQTCIHNGNVPMPLVPSNGWLVYPKRNKWTLQVGTLLARDRMSAHKHHGCTDLFRWTFLISCYFAFCSVATCSTVPSRTWPSSARLTASRASPL